MTERQERFAKLLLRYLDACENGACTSDEAIVQFTLEWAGERVTPPRPQKKWLKCRFLCQKN